MRLVHFEKRGLDTEQAVRTIASVLGSPIRDAGWAGLKDKHAQTTQHVTVEAGRNADKFPKMMEGQSWKAKRVGFVHAPINSQAIQANR